MANTKMIIGRARKDRFGDTVTLNDAGSMEARAMYHMCVWQLRPAVGYLIIWADDDEEEEGLHTNFNLSKEVDFLMLTDGTSVLDSLEFSEQTTNLSSSRIPNGTGDYVIKDATFNFNNELPSGVDNLSDLVIDVNIYPNPTAEDLNITLSDFSNTLILFPFI